MVRTTLISTALIAILGLMAGAVALADPPKDTKSAAQQEPKLPPGWTKEDFAAFIAAATPGKMHERFKQEVGVWHGKNTMWMAPGAPPIESESTSTVTPLFDGRFTRCEMKGEMPGMGPYDGLMISGYDNITQKFVSTWIDNFSTSIAQGEGELSKDGRRSLGRTPAIARSRKSPLRCGRSKRSPVRARRRSKCLAPSPRRARSFR